MPKRDNTPELRVIRSNMQFEVNLLREFVKCLASESADSSTKLRVFDFDDTLVKTDARVGVSRPDGSSFWLTPGEYATYVKRSGDKFDYSEFGQLINPRAIYWTGRILKNVYDAAGPSGIVILTARNSSSPVRQFLDDAGFFGIEIVALGDSDPQAKADWIDEKIRSDERINYVEFFDDSLKNVEAVLALRAEHPNVKIISRHVVHRSERLPRAHSSLSSSSSASGREK